MKKYSLIVAVCENLGMGFKGEIPWKLREEMRYFNKMTRKVSDPSKRNVVIMGRITYMGIPSAHRPLAGRVNIVLSRNPQRSNYSEKVFLNNSLEDAMKRIESEFDDVENVWVIGGNQVFKEALESPRFHRLYLTEIKAKYECDAFFPEIPSDLVEVTLDEDIPQGEQEENGIKYVFKVYEKPAKDQSHGDH